MQFSGLDGQQVRSFMRQLRRRVFVAASVSIIMAMPANADIEIVLATEAAEIASICETHVFKPGFATPVDINGDDLDDYLLDFTHVECERNMRYLCGTGGCPIAFQVARPEGGYDRYGTIFGLSVEFDRPQEASFTVASHGTACGRTGPEECTIRYQIVDGSLVNLGEAD